MNETKSKLIQKKYERSRNENRLSTSRNFNHFWNSLITIESSSKITSVKRYLWSILQRKTNFDYEKKKRNAFNQLQLACITNSIFKMFDTEKSIRLKIETSDLIIKTCINQKYDDKWHSIIYFWRKLSSTEQNYDIHDKKLLAIVIFLKQWRVYAEKTSKFIIFTNHKNLLHFITIKQFNKRQVRWSKLLKQYKFTIFYISKKKNDRTNALSRRNDHMKIKEIFNHNILKINKNESLSINKHELNAILRILKDDQKQYFIKKERFHISNDKIDEIIKNHHDESLQNHSNIFKTLQLLRQTC